MREIPDDDTKVNEEDLIRKEERDLTIQIELRVSKIESIKAEMMKKGNFMQNMYKLAAYRLHVTNPNYSHASSLFLSGGGFFLVKPTFSIIEPHFGHLILLFLIKFSGLQLFILLRKCFAYIFLVLLEYVP